MLVALLLFQASAPSAHAATQLRPAAAARAIVSLGEHAVESQATAWRAFAKALLLKKTGHFEHAASGLTLTLYRAYDSNLGRWLSRDPIGLNGGINLYAYVGNDPINYLDPLGLDATTWGEGFVSGFVGGAIAGLALGAVAALAAGTVFAPFVAAGIVGLAIYGVAAGIHGMLTACTIDEADRISGSMFGGTLGGMLGGAGGAKIGAGVKPHLAGNRTSNLPDYPEPGQITGYTKHGLNQAISRDGVGVSSRAILDAVASPKEVIPQSNGTTQYVGQNATVVLNQAGQVVTTWATSGAGVRCPLR